jgi:Ca-activated chloride channel family protein
MTIDRDDPRLTAYALGEMEKSEREAFEALIAEDPEAQDEVEALRALGLQLEAELSAEAAPELRPAAREALFEAARPRPAWRRLLGPRYAIAATVLLAMGVYAATAPNVFRSPGPAEESLVAGQGGDREEAARSRLEASGPGREARALEAAASRPVGRDDWTKLPDPFTEPAEEAFEAPGASGATVGPDALVIAPPVPQPPSGPTVGLVVEGLAAGARAPAVPVALPPLDLERVRRGETDEDEAFRAPSAAPSTEAYDRVTDNPFVRVSEQDVSTFSIDVDRASYANVRRFLMQMGRLPPPDAVRIEELVNYFPYAYAGPDASSPHPFAGHVQILGCPWEPRHRLVRVGLKGREIDLRERPAANLVFLLDVSGSMSAPNKLPLLKQSLALLVEDLQERDRVSIVVYAGAAGLVLPPTPGSERSTILGALERLQAGGSTNGGAGIQLAYDQARAAFIEGGVNRVILCTDGDFNVGTSDRGSLTRMLEERAKSGVFLTILGFGMGNLKDATMEELSNKGNGNYGYVDSLKEARKLLVEEGLGTLITIAKDVKIQIFFNPRTVAGWRLIGYENRLLRKEDFNDDTKDAGEIGAGHAVTALYEIVPAGQELPGPKADPNPFVERPAPAAAGDDGALIELRLRYKAPDGDTSTLIERRAYDEGLRFDQADEDAQWASAVAAFGMLLRDSPHKGQTTWGLVKEIATAAVGRDAGGYRAEFLEMVERAEQLSTK